PVANAVPRRHAPYPHEAEPMPTLLARRPGRGAALTLLAADFRGAVAAGTLDRAAGRRAVGTPDRAATGRPRVLPLRDPAPRAGPAARPARGGRPSDCRHHREPASGAPAPPVQGPEAAAPGPTLPWVGLFGNACVSVDAKGPRG